MNSNLCRLPKMSPYLFLYPSLKRLLFFLIFIWICLCIFRLIIGNNYVDVQEFREKQINWEKLMSYNFVNSTFYEDRHLRIIDKNNFTSNNLFYDNKVNIDMMPPPTERELFLNLTNTNFPLTDWSKFRKWQKSVYSNSVSSSHHCNILYPSPYELQFNNIYWQQFYANDTYFYLYSAYYDDRWSGGSTPKVRVFAMINKISPLEIICQFWYHKLAAPLLAQASYIYAWHRKWGNYKDGVLQPFIITCDVPQFKGISENIAPVSVSLVEHPCDDPANNLKIYNMRPKKQQEFAVCVKGLDFLHQDISIRLVEWIEMIYLLGADKIFFYHLETHPNVTKVLKFYQDANKVEVTPLSLPGSQPNLPGFRHWYLKKKLIHKRQNELIPYNDCLYRNLYSYKYLILLDIDEVIMPLIHDDWKQLMNHVIKKSVREKFKTFSSFSVRNVYFLDDFKANNSKKDENFNDIPSYLHMFRHLYRSRNYTKPGQFVKSFHSTERIVSLHNHLPLNCFGTCTNYPIDTSLAQLHHYRRDCVGTLNYSCQTTFRPYTLRDDTILKYKQQMIEKTTQVLQKLGFIHA